MFHPRRQHHAFDLGMELLASLPQSPNSVPLSRLAADLELGASHLVADELRRLADRGYSVCTWRALRGEHMVASISRAGWQHASADAQAYIDTVYGDQQPCPTKN